MVVAAAALFIMMVVVMVMLLSSQPLLLHFSKFSRQSGLTFHGSQQLLTGQLTPGSGNQGGNLVVFPNQGNRCIQLLLGHGISPGENDGGSGLDLIVVELTEILGVDLHLTGISHSNGVTKGHFIIRNLLNSRNNVGQLTNAGGFDDDPLGIILVDDLSQRLAEITHQAAADTAGVHLSDVDTGILQEAAVNTDLTELVLNEDQFLTLVGFLNHLFDEGGFARTQETGVNINFRHCIYTFCT